MKFSELIEHAVECIKTFNPVIKTIDSHADSYLEKVSNKSKLRCWLSTDVIRVVWTTSNLSYLFTMIVEDKHGFANAFLL